MTVCADRRCVSEAASMSQPESVDEDAFVRRLPAIHAIVTPIGKHIEPVFAER